MSSGITWHEFKELMSSHFELTEATVHVIVISIYSGKTFNYIETHLTIY